MAYRVGDSRLPDLFWVKVELDPERLCWRWTGGTNSKGYGTFHSLVNGERSSTILAHRIAYLALVGAIPDGLQLDHLCRVPPCVNPAHLEPVTPRVNSLRGVGVAARNAAKTHCPQGHPYSGANLYVRASDGGRMCRTCTNERTARRYGVTYPRGVSA